jgi:acetylornithine deacetylase/succinyl-diaminopimelate desuccinylase-like protein
VPLCPSTTANVVPSSASAVVMFRLVSEPSDVLADIDAIVSSDENVTATVLTQNPPPQIYAPPQAAATFGTYIASYNTDLSYFRKAKKKVLFGGGTIANAHIDDEYITLDDLIRMPSQYEAIVQELLSENAS